MSLVLPGDDGFSFQAIPQDSAENGLEPDDRQAAEIREIFGTAFPKYLQPVEEIVEQILSGDGDSESTEALTGMFSSLMEASSRMGFDNVHQLLGQLQERISSPGPDLSGPIAADVRERILGDIRYHGSQGYS